MSGAILVFTPEHCQRISTAQKNNPKTTARLRTLADEQRGVPKPFSPAHREAHRVAASAATTKMNAARKGDPFWVARARAMAAANVGQPKDNSAVNKKRWGGADRDEQRRLQSERIKKWHADRKAARIALESEKVAA
jgi:hypothetical protein